ncbi:MAG: hypothetical protein QW328_07655 [Nitrososphaerota archaeon]
MRKFLLLSAILSGLAFGESRYLIQTEPEPQRTAISQRTSINPLDIPISINVRGVALPYLFSVISEQVGVPIVIRDIAYPQQAQAGGQTQAGVNEYMQITYYSHNKPLRHVLDEITSHLDLFWKEEEDGRIVVYKYKRESFSLYLPYLQKSIQEKSDPVEISYKREFIKNIDNALKSLLTDPNSKISVDEMGNVFVYARKSEMESVRKMVDSINKRFTKPIPLKVKVLMVSEEDLRDIGVSLSGKLGGISLGSTAGGLVSGPIFSLSVLTKNLEVFLNALAESGKANVIEENMLVALNGQPIVYAPLQKRRIISSAQLSYIAPQTGGGPQVQAIPQISLRTEDIDSGSMMVIVPYYISEDSIVVDLYRKTSTVERLEIRRIDLGGFQNDIILPTTSVRTNVNQTVLRRGQSLVMFSSAMTVQQLRDSGIPLLKDIPILGYLFSRKVKEDSLFRLIISITFAGEDDGQERSP